MRACVFTVAGSRFALPVDEVLELCPEERLTPVPGAPDRVLGVFQRRGRIVPVVRLSEGPLPAGGAGLLVLECASGTVATPVDAVEGVSVLSPGSNVTPLDLGALLAGWAQEVADGFGPGTAKGDVP